MRILFIINNLARGGAERFVLDLITYLNENTSIEYRLAVLDDTNLYTEYDVQTLNITNINYVPFSIRKKNRNEAFSNILDEFQPDIIHTNLFLSEFVTSLDVRKNVTYVCHGHDNMFQYARLTLGQFFSKKRLMNRLDYLLLWYKKYRHVNTHFIANSKHTFDFYSINVPKKQRDHVHLIQYGFNFEQYAVSEKKVPNEKIKLVNVGSYQVKKNQQFFIQVAKELIARNVDFEINLIGHGELFDSIEKKIKEERLESYILQQGIQTNVHEWYQKSDIYIHAATYEPFGLVFLEAMASGLPVITLDGKGNRDIIAEDQNGYLFYEQNAKKFADKIIEYATDKKKYQQISAQAVAFAKQFDASIKMREMIDFYQRIID